RSSEAHYRSTYLADELLKRMKFVADNAHDSNDSIRQLAQKNLRMVQESLRHEPYMSGLTELDPSVEWKLTSLTPSANSQFETYLRGYKKYYSDIYNQAVAAREAWISSREAEPGSGYDVTRAKNLYYSESLADLLMNVTEKSRIIEHDGKLVQQIDPIFRDPQPDHIFAYRAHLFAPSKNMIGGTLSTYVFNVIVIWVMTLALYVALYAEVLRSVVSSIAFLARPSRRRK